MDIPGYDVQRPLAEGGMAAVYLATQQSLRRPVALKVLKHTDNPSFSGRFLEEGRTIAALVHPNIVTIYDVGIIDGVHFISMEYVDGGDLEARIRRGLSPAEALNVTRRLAACLQFVHEHGVVHRDIKPGNVLFRRDGTPLLTDFGIAKQLRTDSGLTHDGTTIGSPYYLSPEQSKGKAVDGRADIYSLGIVLFEMLAGYRPFEGEAAIDTILMHHNQPLPVLEGHFSRYNTLLARMTAKNPYQRFTDCAALLAALDRDHPSSPSLVPASGIGQTQTLVVEPEPPSRKKAVKKRAAKKKSAQKKKGTTRKATAKPAYTPSAATHKRRGNNRARSKQNGRKPLPFVAAGISAVLIAALLYLNRTVLFGLDGSGDDGETVPPVFLWDGDEATNAARLQQILDKGWQRLHQDRLTTPAGDNAHVYFRQALRLDPENPDAHRGLINIADRYAVLAETASRRGENDKAEVFIGRGLNVVPGYPSLVSQRRQPATVVK